MPVHLRWRNSTRLPVDAAGLLPERLVSLSAAEVSRWSLRVGNATASLADLFTIEGSGEDGRLVIEGDLRARGRLGGGMAAGDLSIRGDVGAELGAGMSGGTIDVVGTVGDRA